MTEELLSLTDKIKDALEKNVDMEQKKDELLRKLVNTMEDNYNKLIAEEVKIYDRLAGDLKLKFKCDAVYKNDKTGLKLRYVSPDGSEAYLRRESNGFMECMNIRYEFSQQSGRKDENWVRAFSGLLDTEEHTLQTLEQIRKGYSDIFREYLECIDAENKGLARDIESLSARLAGSSVIREGEDGTVEIRLGNRVFRGKVTEE